MSKVSFSQPRNAYDEEQAFQRHLAYLKTQSKISQGFQDAQRNIQLGVEPTMAEPKTADEILQDEGRVNSLVTQYLERIFGRRRTSQDYNPATSTETEDAWLRRVDPAKWVEERLSQDQRLLLVQEFPAIASELKDKRLITPDSFGKYLNNYQVAYERSGGTSKYGQNAQLLNDIKALFKDLPTATSIDNISKELDTIKGILPRDIDLDIARVQRQLDFLRMATPTRDQLDGVVRAIEKGNQDVLSRVDDNAVLTAETIITRLTRELDKLPSEAYITHQTEVLYTILRDIEGKSEFDRMIREQGRKASEAQKREMMREMGQNIADLKIWIDDMIENTKGITKSDVEDIFRMLRSIQQDSAYSSEFIAGLDQEQLDALKKSIRLQLYAQFKEENAGKTPSKAEKERIDRLAESEASRRIGTKGSVQTTIPALFSQINQDYDEQGTKVSGNTGDTELAPYMSTSPRFSMTPAQTQERRAGKKGNLIIVEDEDTTGGVGIKSKVRMIKPYNNRIVGKGLALVEEPKKYYEFGKYCISMPHLANNTLKVKYLHNGNEVPSFRQTKISEEMRDFIEDLCETERLNEKVLNKLPSSEKRLFAKLINQSGLYGQYKVRLQKNPEEEDEEKRFELVKGQYIAGNDNPAIIKELKHLIIKFMMEGKIPKNQGNDLLFQLSV
jgi:hypothetical protein